MLVVSRKVGERVFIGDQITVTVIKVSGGGVRIGIEAPRELAVVREELAQQVEREELSGSQGPERTLHEQDPPRSRRIAPGR